MRHAAARPRRHGLTPLGWLRLWLGRQRAHATALAVDAPIHLAPF